MVTLTDFYLMLRRIVQAYPADDCRRLNTFAVVTSLNTALSWDNLGKIASDHTQNLFWNRQWADGGYRDEDITFKLDGLLVRNVYGTVDNPFASSTERIICHTLEIAVVSKADCDGCQDCDRTPEIVDIDNAANLVNVLSELKGFAQYKNINLGQGVRDYWLTAAERLYWIGKGKSIGNMPACYLKGAVTGNGRIDYSKQGAELFQVASTVIDFCGCNIEPVAWDYGINYGEMGEPVRCSTC